MEQVGEDDPSVFLLVVCADDMHKLQIEAAGDAPVRRSSCGQPRTIAMSNGRKQV